MRGSDPPYVAPASRKSERLTGSDTGGGHAGKPHTGHGRLRARLLLGDGAGRGPGSGCRAANAIRLGPVFCSSTTKAGKPPDLAARPPRRLRDAGLPGRAARRGDHGPYPPPRGRHHAPLRPPRPAARRQPGPEARAVAGPPGQGRGGIAPALPASRLALPPPARGRRRRDAGPVLRRCGRPRPGALAARPGRPGRGLVSSARCAAPAAVSDAEPDRGPHPRRAAARRRPAAAGRGAGPGRPQPGLPARPAMAGPPSEHGSAPRPRRTARFHRLARDYERLPQTVASLHFVAFVFIMLSRATALFDLVCNSV